MFSVPLELQVVKISRAFHYSIPHNVVVLVCETPAGTKYALQKKLPFTLKSVLDGFLQCDYFVWCIFFFLQYFLILYGCYK